MITLAELKQYLQIATADTSQDAFVQTCADNAISTVNDYCNRDLRSATYTEYVDGNGDKITISNYPVTSISVLQYYDNSTYDYADIISSPDTIANSTRIIPNSRFVRLVKGYSFEPGESNIKIIYLGGYSTAPADIKGVCLEIASVYYKNSYAGVGGGRLGVTNSSTTTESKVESITFDPDITKKWQSILNQYRNINV